MASAAPEDGISLSSSRWLRTPSNDPGVSLATYFEPSLRSTLARELPNDLTATFTVGRSNANLLDYVGHFIRDYVGIPAAAAIDQKHMDRSGKPQYVRPGAPRVRTTQTLIDLPGLAPKLTEPLYCTVRF